MMRQSLFLRAFVAAFFVAACAVAASAQVTQISGKVTMKQADGTSTPVANAQIDIYRLDIRGQFETKTNKRGEYTHAGIPFGGRYAIAVSAPGARPTFSANLRLNQQPENHFELTPGDGKRLTLEEIRAAIASGGAGAASGGESAGPSEADKKAAAELAAKVKEIEEQNKKIEASNAVVSRTFQAGNAALQAGRYDEAIAAYSEGLAAREEIALYTNRAEALRLRGAARYNEGLKNSDAAGRTASLDAAQKDWRDALASTSKAVAMVKAAASTPADPAAQGQAAGNRLAALGSHARVLALIATRVEKTPARADEAFAAFQEYINAETDTAKKNRAMFEAANIYFDAGVYDRAVAEFEKVVAADPNNAEAYFKLGSALMNTGDKTKYQAAANYLNKFAELAPDTNPLKADAKSLLQFLKEQENVKPMRIETPRTGRRRG